MSAATVTCQHTSGSNPRHNPPDGDPTCIKCGRLFTPPPSPDRERDFAVEQELTLIAAESVGAMEAAGSLSAFADARALPGPVRTEGRDFDQEVFEELADARNYLVWSIQEVWQGAKDGDSEAAAIYCRRMQCLAAVVKAYRALLYKGP